MYVCVCACRRMCVCAGVCICVCCVVCVYVCMYVCMRCVYVCVCVVYMCMCVCVCACVRVFADLVFRKQVYGFIIRESAITIDRTAPLDKTTLFTPAFLTKLCHGITNYRKTFYVNWSELW